MIKQIDSYKIDVLLQPVLRQIEKNGVKIDVDLLTDLSKKLDLQIQEISSVIFQYFNHQINLNSPSQLAKVLYDELKIGPREKKIKYGKQHFSTGARSLEKIKHLHPVIEKILQYREMMKLKSAYVDPLPKLVDQNNRIHTHYAVDTATGRLSSKNPNLQNIPTRTKYGKKVKQVFIAQDKYRLVKFDYSQIELRVIAFLSGDEDMMDVFRSQKDIHLETAKKMGVNRRMAKIINFGVLYGMGSYGLSERLNIRKDEAQDFINSYFATYPGLKKYFDQMIENAKKYGFVKTMYGRKREVKELKSNIYQIRKLGERIAVNTPAQGTAAEIIKMAMISIYDKILLKNSGLINTDCRMVLQIHDELVFEIKHEKMDKYIKTIKNIMENEVKIKVPLVVNVSYGSNLLDIKNINL
jgi:DNA polymerase-1